MKYMVDTNIFNWLIDGTLSTENFPQETHFVATHIQHDELNKTPDSAAKKPVREPLPTVVYKRFAWSSNSHVYHYSICADVRRILRKNLQTEDQAPKDRSLHAGCPVP